MTHERTNLIDSHLAPDTASVVPAEDPLWYKNAVVYEVHVRAFRDSDGNGSGDFLGLMEKLDYVRELGVTAVWLLPFWPSPWKDDGYDSSNYCAVHESFGTLEHFREFLSEAHARGIRVITELVLNHTSDQHPWFLRARSAPAGSRWRDFYVWSDKPEKYSGARIIFKDFEKSNWTWDPVAKLYYWHRFYAHQPDLNYDSPDVRRAVTETVEFWLDQGVDGLRLDAVPYLFECEDTHCENLPETHAFLRELRAHIDSKYRNRMLLAEANQWPEDAAAYFGAGDECHMAFHFPVMPRLFMALRSEEAYPIVDILKHTPAIPESCQWALFLRNHDELTLEMVREEERDYMYRTYASDPEMRINLGIRRRLAPLLDNDRRRIELMHGLLFSLPGTPVIYYGDEIGMGENLALGDRNSVRTPMQWSSGSNAGFSEADPVSLYLPVVAAPEYHYGTVNVEVQERNPQSLLWWMRKLIALRMQSQALARGSLEFVLAQNRYAIAFLRRLGGESILVVANLSRYAQPVELRLEDHAGCVPVEMFGGAEFPRIERHPYLVTLAPYAFHWFRLRPPAETQDNGHVPPFVTEIDSLESLLVWEKRARLAELLPGYLRVQPWFRDYLRTIATVEVTDIFPFTSGRSALVIVLISFTGGDPERYLLPVSIVTGPDAANEESAYQARIIARLQSRDCRDGLLVNAASGRDICTDVTSIILHGHGIRGQSGTLAGNAAAASRANPAEFCPLPAAATTERRNAIVSFGDAFVLKLFRRLEDGPNPDLEIGAYLSGAQYPHVPALEGWLEYRPEGGSESTTIGVLQAFAPNKYDSWSGSLRALGGFFDRALSSRRRAPLELISGSSFDLAVSGLPPLASDLMQPYVERVRKLGNQTADLHRVLAAGGAECPQFTPEPSTYFYQAGVYHGMLSLLRRTLELLDVRMEKLPGRVQRDAARVVELGDEIRGRLEGMRRAEPGWARIRIHGDFHLEHALWTGRDFVFIDFEGENFLPIAERRIKASPLQDVAAMIQSFQYAANAALFGQASGVVVHSRNSAALKQWGQVWYACAAASFLAGYLERADPALLPRAEDRPVLMDAFIIWKSVYQLQYELNSRPEWVPIALHSLLHLIDRCVASR